MSNKMMSLDDFYKVHNSLKDNEVILDVRREDEFADGHIENARNIPVDQVG